VTLVFIVRTALDPYAGFADVIECAKLRANCPIWVISDQPDPGGVNYVPISEFPVGDRMREKFSEHMNAWSGLTLARWYVLREFIKRYDPPFPIICMDWDVMIFRDLAEAYAPFAEDDYTVSVLGDLDSAAYGINRLEPLEAFCDMVERISEEDDPRRDQLNDMLAWQQFRHTDSWTVGNLFEIRDGSVFDHNIHCGADRFVMDGEAKRVVFLDGMPHFVSLDGSLVVANTIHCWGTYKTRTRELLYAAFLGEDPAAGATWYRSTEEFEAVLGLAGPSARGEVVAVGAGARMDSLAFKDAGARRSYAALPGSTGGVPVRAVGDRGESLLLAEGVADLVYSREAIGRADDPTVFATLCAALLRSGGFLIAAREPVVSDGVQLDEFLVSHTGGERAYPLAEYVSALEGAGLRVIKVLRPLDSVVNHYPLEARTALRRRFGPIGTALSHVPFIYRQALRRIAPEAETSPGRLYTFIAMKPV
jgi:hypothetical protein